MALTKKEEAGASRDQREAYIALARQDSLHGFLAYVALTHTTDNPEINEGSATAAPHHVEMARALTGPGNVCIVMPRGAAKTTYLQAWIEWRIGIASLSGDKEWANRVRFLYVSGAEGQAMKVSLSIKDMIDGNTQRVPYAAIFPKVKPKKDEWAAGQWKVQGNTTKDPTFQATGLRGAALGSRVPYLIFDDPVTDESKSSVGEMEAIVGGPQGEPKGRLNDTFMPILIPRGRAVMMTTRWGLRDPAWWATEKRGWQKVERKAIETDAEGNEYSYWPDVWPLERLDMERQADPFSFAQQFQGEVAPAEGVQFQREWFQPPYTLLPTPDRILCRVDSWDTASSAGRKRSYTVGLQSTVTYEPGQELPIIYITHMLRGQVPIAYQLEAIQEMVLQNHTDYCVIEDKSSGITLLQLLMKAVGKNRRGEYILTPWTPTGQKGQSTTWSGLTRDQHIRAIQEFCKRGIIRLPDAPWTGEFLRDVLSYPTGETDDVVSALAQLILFVLQNPGKMIGWDGPRQEKNQLRWETVPSIRAAV